jgi:lipoprotein-anchoring transpeptidase ErfK/SrfK
MPPCAIFSPRFIFLGFAALLASCAGPSSRDRGQTQYLEAFDPASVPHSALYNQDQDSYWDGDGMTGPPSVIIDLSDQKAYFYKGGALAGVSALSTGDEKHPTQTGNFKIIQKDQWHKSNLYGDFVDAYGQVVVANVDLTKDKPPAGTRFEGSKMHHFMRFVGGTGMHEGFLPGYPASHGCVRMPGHMAAIFYNNVSVGTPVTVRP